MDDMDDDVFESSALAVDANSQQRHPSPTGYRDYKPPEEVLRMCQTDYIDDTEQVVHKVSRIIFILTIYDFSDNLT